jgi:putative PIN family toxin of toxin-antitoxin system
VKPTVVIDTNVLLSGLLWPRGNPHRCLILARLGTIEAVTCEEILREFHEKLVDKFHFDAQHAAAAVEEWRHAAHLVSLTQRVQVIADDPDDDVVLSCALSGNAGFIISGDHHLLALGRYAQVVIISPSDFLIAHPWMRETPSA